MSIHDRIKQRRLELEMSMEELAELSGLKSWQAVQKWEKNIGGSAPKRTLLPKVAAILGVTPDWLLTGNDTPSPPVSLKSIDSNHGSVSIPQYKDVGGAMGHGIVLRDQPGEITAMDVSPEWVAKNIRHHTGVHNLCIVTGFGNSMQPLYNPGDPLIVDRGVNTVEVDATYFFRVGNEGFIKLLQRIPGEGIRVISKNKDFETWTIKEDMDFQVFGQVLKAWCGTDV